MEAMSYSVRICENGKYENDLGQDRISIWSVALVVLGASILKLCMRMTGSDVAVPGLHVWNTCVGRWM